MKGGVVETYDLIVGQSYEQIDPKPLFQVHLRYLFAVFHDFDLAHVHCRVESYQNVEEKAAIDYRIYVDGRNFFIFIEVDCQIEWDCEATDNKADAAD